MKKILLLITIAINFSMGQVDELKYDDYNRCNTSGATLASGIYVPTDMWEQIGYVCRLASLSDGTVVFWLGTSADCSKFHTTKMTTYYSKQNQPLELDVNHPNHELRLVLSPVGGSANMFGVAVMASQLISANIRLQSVSRVD